LEDRRADGGQLFDRSEKAMGRNLRATVNNLLVRRQHRQQRQQRQQCPLSRLDSSEARTSDGYTP